VTLQQRQLGREPVRQVDPFAFVGLKVQCPRRRKIGPTLGFGIHEAGRGVGADNEAEPRVPAEAR
jgi:hypothetical protein